MYVDDEQTIVQTLAEAQAPNGALPSAIHTKDRVFPDYNCFITAQVLRALHDITGGPLLAAVRERALAYLAGCGSAALSGAYGFWPVGQNPGWIAPLPPDADDTAIVALELFRYGRLDLYGLRRIAAKVLLPYRLPDIEPPAPPWLRPGVFYTWLRPGPAPNIVDCCVNANVVALLAAAGLEHWPGYVAACTMIESGVAWAGDDLRARGSLSPFYPHTGELVLAVAYAVARGASALTPALAALRRWSDDGSGEIDRADVARPICSSAYGQVWWTSRILQEVRATAVKAEAAPRTAPP